MLCPVYFTTIKNTQEITEKKLIVVIITQTLDILMYLKCDYTNRTFLNGYII